MSGARRTQEDYQTILDAINARDGGSGKFIRQNTRLLTNAEIKALPTTGIEIVPAPGEGRAVLVLNWFRFLNTEAGAYTNVTGAQWYLLYNNSATASAFDGNVANALSSAEASYGWAPGTPSSVGTGDIEGATTGTNANSSEIANKNVTIKDDYASSGDYTGGHVTNTMRVTVLYFVVNTVTGELVAA